MNLIKKKLNYKEYREADMIIRYLTSPEDESIQLTLQQKNKLDILEEIHGYRLRYKRKSFVVNLLSKKRGISKRQAYNYIDDAEYVFGSVDGVNKVYERNFLLEASRKNIEIAFKSKDSSAISKAITTHSVLAGLDKEIPDMPDFANLEQHEYIINLPDHVLDVIKQLVNLGQINLNNIQLPETIDISHAEEKSE